jgi:hypothetical protein
MQKRATLPAMLAAEVITHCRRRCTLCFALHADLTPQKGQVAHIDHDRTNTTLNNLVWLCLAHHDEFDSRGHQTKGYLPAEIQQYKAELELCLFGMPKPQKVRWGPNDGLPAGISINHKNGTFLPWSRVKPEIESRLIVQLGRHIPPKCFVAVKDLFDRKDWIVSIFSPTGAELGRVWVGSDPEKNWRFDGLVRVGSVQTIYSAEVWQVFQRYSDGSYRLLGARVPRRSLGLRRSRIVTGHTSLANLQQP